MSPTKPSAHLISLTLLLVVAIAQQPTWAFQFKDCASDATPDAKLDSVLINSCPDASGDRCILTRGTNASIKIDFDAVKTFSEANMSIKAKLGFAYIPFHFSPTQACGNYGFNCPVQAGQKVQLDFTLPVLSVYPKLALEIFLQIVDEKKNPIVCIQFPAKIN